MRTDEKTRLEEHRKHLLQEMRSMTDAVKAVDRDLNDGEQRRFGEVEKQISEINGELQDQHERELQEVRTRGNGGGFEFPQAAMSRTFAREPLYEAFRSAGFARGKSAEILWPEFRSITWTGSVDNVNSPRRAADMLGYDQRYAYQALPSVGVDRGLHGREPGQEGRQEPAAAAAAGAPVHVR
jgi:hypothetical protein